MNHDKNVLLFIAFSLNPSNKIFSHQVEVAKRLSPYFRSMYILSDEVSNDKISPNSQIYSFGVKKYRNQKLNRVFSVIRFLRIATFVIFKFRSHLIVFGHMTDIYSFLLSPLTFLLRIPHYLWYAHTNNSFYMRFNSKLLAGILTSTRDSYPVMTPKVRIIGQGIDFRLFPFYSKRNYDRVNRLVYFGRLDCSKRIDQLIFLLESLKINDRTTTLTLIGEPTTGNVEYFQVLLSKYRHLLEDGSLTVAPPKNRNELHEALREFDLFVHAFPGSLDKTLLEAASTGIPILTLNPPFRRLLQVHGLSYNGTTTNLNEMYQQWVDMNPRQRKNYSAMLADVVKQNHSIEKWTDKLLDILLSHESAPHNHDY
jgi:glycosyltransferase involved in cell wall biosynthesis